jgi:serine/threonine protein kinase
VQVLCDVATRLQQLHAAGYVHRDVKPGNVLWRPTQFSWTLIDFGCAAAIGAPPSLLPTAVSNDPVFMRRFWSFDKLRNSRAGRRALVNSQYCCCFRSHSRERQQYRALAARQLTLKESSACCCKEQSCGGTGVRGGASGRTSHSSPTNDDAPTWHAFSVIFGNRG